jgi:hypothetical protein
MTSLGLDRLGRGDQEKRTPSSLPAVYPQIEATPAQKGGGWCRWQGVDLDQSQALNAVAFFFRDGLSKAVLKPEHFVPLQDTQRP